MGRWQTLGCFIAMAIKLPSFVNFCPRKVPSQQQSVHHPTVAYTFVDYLKEFEYDSSLLVRLFSSSAQSRKRNKALSDWKFVVFKWSLLSMIHHLKYLQLS